MVRRAVLFFTLVWVVAEGGTSWAQIKLYRAAIRGKALDARGRPAVGARAPEIQVTRWVNDAGVKHLSDLRNKMVVLQFSSAHNRAAQASNAALKKLHDALQARGRDDVVILALYDASAGAGTRSRPTRRPKVSGSQSASSRRPGTWAPTARHSAPTACANCRRSSSSIERASCARSTQSRRS
jgi:hypothetical protein